MSHEQSTQAAELMPQQAFRQVVSRKINELGDQNHPETVFDRYAPQIGVIALEMPFNYLEEHDGRLRFDEIHAEFVERMAAIARSERSALDKAITTRIC
ncbi:MAG TPA: hypothetical protein VF575_02695 [Candidatus Saccharimonadales bacterium]|jgi:hypothetical protein